MISGAYGVKENELLKLTFTCFFVLFLMWLQENLKFSMWLTFVLALYNHWTVLCYPMSETNPKFLKVPPLSKYRFIRLNMSKLLSFFVLVQTYF